MASLVVVVAPDGPMAGALSVLRDWSVVGLVDPFVWVDQSMITPTSVGAFSSSGSSFDLTSLQSVATRARYDQVRLVILVPVLDGVEVLSATEEQRIAELLEVTVGGAPVTRIRAIVSRAGDNARSSELARGGWHNLLLAAEESEGPGLGHALLPVSSDPIVLGAHTAASIAGIAGLWSDVAESPLDGEAPLSGTSVRIVRSFYRSMQGQELESELRARVTATSESLPLPVEGGAASVYVQDTALATSTMAAALWQRHAEILRGPREVAPRSSTKPIGAWGAIKLFFGFLAASLRNAPQQWYRSAVVKVSSRVAGTVHGVVFGSNPAEYSVVVNGVTPDGLPASWLDLGEAAGAIETSLDNGPVDREHHAVTDFSSLWVEYCAGALTLADGGQRVDGLVPVQIGTRRAVLRSVGLCVPSPSARFDAIPGHLVAQTGISGVDAYDVLAVNNLHGRLSRIQQDPSLGLDASQTIEALEKWSGQNRGSYASRVGSTLGEAVVKTAAEVKGLLESLKAAGATDDLPAAISSKQSKLAKTLRILSIVFVVLAIAVGVATGFGALTLATGLIIGGSLLVVWLVAMITAFFRGQRDLFRLINSRRELAGQAEVMKRNLRQAVRDLRRLTDAYAQYLAWSRVLGALLESPLGSVPAQSDDGMRLAPELPLPVRLGSAVVEEAAMGNAVIALRRDVFRSGWLSEPWNALVAAAPGLLGPDGFELRDDPIALFRQPAGADSLLLKWVELVEVHGVSTDVADVMWSTIREQLDTSKREIAAELLGSIVGLGSTTDAKTPLAAFMARVDEPESVLSGQFDLSVLTPTGQTSNRAQVDRTWGASRRIGLSRVAVLTQLSAGAPDYEYTAFESAGEVPVADADGYGLRNGPVF